MILAIDTSTRYAGVALADPQGVVSCHCWHASMNHTAELMPAVAQILRSQHLTPRELEGIAVALGPGGFSALRVGISAAKGLALATKRQIVGIGTLDLEAFPYLESGHPVCAVLDAGRGEVASALFSPEGRRTRDDLISTPDALLDAISGSELPLPLVLFCGEGVTTWSHLIRNRLGTKGLVVAHHTPANRLWSLAKLAGQRLAAGESSHLSTITPYYLRMPSIGAPKQRDRSPQQS